MLEANELNPKVLANESPIRVELKHPNPAKQGELLRDDQGNTVVYEVWGSDSTKYEEFYAEERRISAGQPSTYEAEIDRAVRCLAHCTESVPENLLILGEKRSALETYKMEPWIFEQVSQAARNRANLYKK